MASDKGNMYDVDTVGVPRGRGESWGELAERHQPDATLNLSCPNDCFELEAAVSTQAGDAQSVLEQSVVREDFTECPNCGAALSRGETDGE